MTLYVVAVGRVKPPALRDACETFVTRIRHYLKLEVKEVRDAGRRGTHPQIGRRIEGAALLQAVPRDARLVALTRSGRSLTSVDFAECVRAWQRDGRDVALILGGAHGLHEDVLDRASDRVSLSPLTLPHDLARVVVLEQLYRACTMIRGEPYHKGALS